MVFDELKQNVLILEDIESRRLDIESNLKTLGYIPHSAESRQEFLQIYHKIPAYAVILDNNAPYDIGGDIKANVGIYLAYHFLREEEGVKVALHTDTKKNDDIKRLEKIGLIYLTKPASIDDLKLFLG